MQKTEAVAAVGTVTVTVILISDKGAQGPASQGDTGKRTTTTVMSSVDPRDCANETSSDASWEGLLSDLPSQEQTGHAHATTMPLPLLLQLLLLEQPSEEITVGTRDHGTEAGQATYVTGPVTRTPLPLLYKSWQCRRAKTHPCAKHRSTASWLGTWSQSPSVPSSSH